MTTPFAPRRYNHDSGDRILANLNRAAAAVNARRMFVLSDEQMTDIEQRRAGGESWASIARVYHMSHTTLMAAYERQTRAIRRAGAQEVKPCI